MPLYNIGQLPSILHTMDFGHNQIKTISICRSTPYSQQSTIMHYRDVYYRYLILFGLSYSGLALFFCIEIPSGIQETIIKVFNIDSSKYNLFFSSYTWSEVILSIASGVLIDRIIGHRAGYLIFLFIAVVGQGIVTAGAFMNIFEMAVIGRFVMGCGTGTINSIISVYIARWFKHKEIVFATSLVFCCFRLGASLGLLVPRLLYDCTDNLIVHNYSQIGVAFHAGSLLLLSSLFVCAFTVATDFVGSKRLNKPPFEMKTQCKIKELKLDFFSLRFYISNSILAFYLVILYLFVANSQLYFMSKYSFTMGEANMANILVFLAPVIVTPIIGYLVDIVGYNTWWGIIGAILGMITHLMFMVTSNNTYIMPYLLCCLFSLSYSFFVVSIYVLPSFIVPEHQLTTAYNIFNILLSLNFTGSSVIVGLIVDYAGYMWLESFYFFVLYAILILTIVLTVLDYFVEDKRKKINKAGTWLKTLKN